MPELQWFLSDTYAVQIIIVVVIVTIYVVCLVGVKALVNHIISYAVI